MALWMWLLILISVLAVIVVLYRHHKESSDFPPGFPRYPFVGSLLSLPLGKSGSYLIIHSTEFAHKYGKLMGYFAGPTVRFAIVQDFELAKEMVYNDMFTGRIDHPISIDTRGLNDRHVGVIATHGQIWKVNRRFSLTTLRDFGFGKKSLGSVIAEEATAAMETFKSKSGQDVLIDQNFNIPIFNILWSMVAAKRFQPDDPQIGGYMKMLAAVFKDAYFDIVFPWVRFIYPKAYNRNKKYYNTLKDMFKTVIDDHRNSLSNDGDPKDFIEVYLREMKENSELTNNDLIGICMDFFEAGGETVGSTLSWVMMYLARYPDVQEKCYLELQSVVGSDSPTLDDRPRLTYCEATIMEIQRLSCVAPSGLEHRAIEDTYLGGYKIPQGAHLFYNIWKFHHDPAYFPDPWTFKPERFLSADGSGIVRNEHFIPFGMGKRVCMGESLAKAELFLFFTILVQMLKVAMPRDHNTPSEDDYEAGITRSPNPFHVHITAR